MQEMQRDFDPEALDIATPEHYERNGYPHPEWTWLRRHAPVFWYDRAERRAVLGHHQARRHRRARQAAGSLPERAAPGGVHPRSAAATGGIVSASAQHGPSGSCPLSTRDQRLVHAARHPRHGRQGGARRRARWSTRRRRSRRATSCRTSRRASPSPSSRRCSACRSRIGSSCSAGRTRSSPRRTPSSSTARRAQETVEGARLELFTYFDNLVARAARAAGERHRQRGGQRRGERQPPADRRAAVLLLPARRRRQRDDAQRDDGRHARLRAESGRVGEAARATRRCSTAPSRRSCAGRRR